MPIDERNGPARLAALDRTLAAAPIELATEDVWLFVYGSMLERPPFADGGSMTMRLEGWSRRFCLADPEVRGTETAPGLTLGLVEGGACEGVAWKVPRLGLRDSLAAVWAGEMRLPMYVARWAPAPAGIHKAAILTLVADIDGPLFEPDLDRQTIVRRLLRCTGEKGPNRDYLEEVVRGLGMRGLSDPYLDRLRCEITTRLARP